MNDMSLESLTESLHQSVTEPAQLFSSQDTHTVMARFLTLAAQDFDRRRPLAIVADLTLVADQSSYPAPTGLKSIESTDWGNAERNQYDRWDGRYPGPAPQLRLRRTTTGDRQIWLNPPPSADQIGRLGSLFTFTYKAGHSLSETAADTTIEPEDRSLLLLRAQIEMLKELSMRNIGKPVTVRDGISGVSRNSTPPALYRLLLEEYENS